MLQSLTRAKFEQIIPTIATGKQYAHYWGKWPDLLNRLLISVVAVVVVLILRFILGESAEALILLLSIIGGFYWLWAPVYQASMRNVKVRRFQYSGFWRSRIDDIYLTEELIGQEETVNQRGELVIVENRERRINLVLGDETGFSVTIQAPLQRIYKNLKVGQTAELLLLSNRRDLSTIDKVTDAYIPSQNLWIGSYPWLQRDVFLEVSRQLGGFDNSYKSRANSRSNHHPLPRRRYERQ
jgi:hypothetical protein